MDGGDCLLWCVGLHLGIVGWTRGFVGEEGLVLYVWWYSENRDVGWYPGLTKMRDQLTSSVPR